MRTAVLLYAGVVALLGGDRNAQAQLAGSTHETPPANFDLRLEAGGGFSTYGIAARLAVQGNYWLSSRIGVSLGLGGSTHDDIDFTGSTSAHSMLSVEPGLAFRLGGPGLQWLTLAGVGVGPSSYQHEPAECASRWSQNAASMRCSSNPDIEQVDPDGLGIAPFVSTGLMIQWGWFTTTAMVRPQIMISEASNSAGVLFMIGVGIAAAAGHGGS